MDSQIQNTLKKELSSGFLETYLSKVLGFIFSIFLLWCIEEILIKPVGLMSILYIVICLIVFFHSIRFSLFAKIVTMDDTFFYVSGLGRGVRIPITTGNMVDQTFLMKISSPTHVMLTFNRANQLKKRVVFIPNKKAFPSNDFIRELNDIIREKRGLPHI